MEVLKKNWPTFVCTVLIMATVAASSLYVTKTIRRYAFDSRYDLDPATRRLDSIDDRLKDIEDKAQSIDERLMPTGEYLRHEGILRSK